LRRRFPEAEIAYQQIRTVNDPVLIDVWLARLAGRQPDGDLAVAGQPAQAEKLSYEFNSDDRRRYSPMTTAWRRG